MATACACWLWLPGTAIDRCAFTTVVRGFANPPFFLTGNGSHDSPWNLRTFASQNLTESSQAPVIVSLGDDPEGFFQSSPPSPIDLAVILTNFQRLGASKAATAVVLAWDSTDPIGLVALDKALGRFDSLVMAAPLSRGAVPEPMPPAFRKASVPLESVHGDLSQLPVVNRVPLAGVILGKDNTAAGFQVIDSEPNTQRVPLLARWEDRVVFAFPVLVVLQRLDLPPAGVEIRLGEYLKLGPDGPTVPVDRYGRMAVPLKSVASYAEIPAESLIDAGNDRFPKQAPPPVVLRDDRSAAEPATRAFSKKLPALIAALASDTGLAPPRDYPRLQTAEEIFLLALVALALAALCGLPAFTRHIGFLAVATACLTAQCLAAGTAHLWLPGLPALAAIAWALVLSRIIALKPAAPVPALSIHNTPGWVLKHMPKPAPEPAVLSEYPAAPVPAPAPVYLSDNPPELPPEPPPAVLSEPPPVILSEPPHQPLFEPTPVILSDPKPVILSDNPPELPPEPLPAPPPAPPPETDAAPSPAPKSARKPARKSTRKSAGKSGPGPVPPSNEDPPAPASRKPARKSRRK